MPANIPWEIRHTLRPGTVYYFQHRALSSVEPHYFIVVNINPLGDELLLMAVASSKLENVRLRRRGLPPETLVEISQLDYDEFTKQSIVDCNKVFRKSLAELVEDWRRGVVSPMKDLPRELLFRIQAGIMISPMVEEEAKALIR